MWTGGFKLIHHTCMLDCDWLIILHVCLQPASILMVLIFWMNFFLIINCQTTDKKVPDDLFLKIFIKIQINKNIFSAYVILHSQSQAQSIHWWAAQGRQTSVLLAHPSTDRLETYPSDACVSSFRYNLGQGGFHVCSSWSSGSGLCQTRTSDHRSHLSGQSGTVCPQVPGPLAEETRRMGTWMLLLDVLIVMTTEM